jgi:hypothetical protein
MDTAQKIISVKEQKFATKAPKHQISPKPLVRFGVLVLWWQKRMKNLKQLT